MQRTWFLLSEICVIGTLVLAAIFSFLVEGRSWESLDIGDLHGRCGLIVYLSVSELR